MRPETSRRRSSSSGDSRNVRYVPGPGMIQALEGLSEDRQGCRDMLGIRDQGEAFEDRLGGLREVSHEVVEIVGVLGLVSVPVGEGLEDQEGSRADPQGAGVPGSLEVSAGDLDGNPVPEGEFGGWQDDGSEVGLELLYLPRLEGVSVPWGGWDQEADGARIWFDVRLEVGAAEECRDLLVALFFEEGEFEDQVQIRGAHMTQLAGEIRLGAEEGGDLPADDDQILGIGPQDPGDGQVEGLDGGEMFEGVPGGEAGLQAALQCR